MKEKITAFVTLGCIFSLFFYYKIYSPSNETLATVDDSFQAEEVVAKLVDEVIIDNEISISSDSYDAENNFECVLSQDQTDDMSFSDAFKHYRNCNGINGSFLWKNNSYSTLLKDEVNVVQSLASKENSSNIENKIDDYHFDLQKEIVGVTIKSK